ncbi:MAG: transglycosylase SLT domain-containing protein [Syntrophorhabdaceae bacterium]|nr:transglycosylase SLT domain-containing protein [Syntrophorhabdaceae bacterium]
MNHLVLIFLLLTILSGCTATKIATPDEKDTTKETVTFRKLNITLPNLYTYPPRESIKEKELDTPQRDTIKEQGLVDLNGEEDDNIVEIFERDFTKDFDIPIVFNDAVKYFIQYFTTEKRKVFENWLKRSRYYVPKIRAILREKGLPEDLVYLAMIESGFNPRAYSPAKASGPWQFIYETGGRYGLKVNTWVDERRDPEKSTVAAAKYLNDLFNQFGCWYLAAAGYNAGENRIERAIIKHNTNDFWELIKYNTLPKETREYIPKLIAAAIIAKEPEKYGFGSIKYDQPIKFQEVAVPPATPLEAIAKAASIDMDSLRSINPELLKGITPPDVDGYRIKLPYNTDMTTFQKQLEAASKNYRKIKSVSTYRTKKGDNLGKIAKRYKVTVGELILVNSPSKEFNVKPGTVINIPRFVSLAKENRTPKEGETRHVAVNPPAKENKIKNPTTAKGNKSPYPTYHIVKKGETLLTISKKYNIDTKDIKKANNMVTDTIYPNMRLKLVKHVQKKEGEPKNLSVKK